MEPQDPVRLPQTPPAQPSIPPQPVPPQPQSQYGRQGQHQVVQVMRPVNPTAPTIPEAIQRRHEASKQRYPHLNLSPGEIVLDSVKRHPIGIVKIWIVVGLLIFAMAIMALFFTSLFGSEGAVVTGAMGTSLLFAGVVFMAVLFVLGGIVATYVYNANRFYLTSESVVQEIMISLFNRHVQTVSLSNIEDASFRQEGILPHILNYGDIRLSTEGDETTYRFSYVSNPAKHIATLNNAVEAFKNGRPVVDPEEDLD